MSQTDENPDVQKSIAEQKATEPQGERLDLDPVDSDYEEWVICEPVDDWDKNGIECVIENKKWYRKKADDDDAEEELMTESLIGVIYGPPELGEVTADRLNELLDVDNPNGVVKRGSNIGIDTIHSELIEGKSVSEDEMRDQINWIAEQLTMLI